MHIERVGYVGIESDQVVEINEAIRRCHTSDLDCHESEIMTEADPKLIEMLKGSVLSDEQADMLLKECDIIKFYT